MHNKFTTIIMLVFLLTTQVGESFSLSNLPCAQDDMMIMNAQMADHSMHAMAMDTISATAEQDCCEKDCSCPVGVISIALYSEPKLNTLLANQSTKVLTDASSLHDIFLASPQRPPIHFFI